MKGPIVSLVPISENQLSLVVSTDKKGKLVIFERLVCKHEDVNCFTNDHLLEIGAYMNRSDFLRDTFPELVNNLYKQLYMIHPLYIPTKVELVAVIQPLVAAWFLNSIK